MTPRQLLSPRGLLRIYRRRAMWGLRTLVFSKKVRKEWGEGRGMGFLDRLHSTIWCFRWCEGRGRSEGLPGKRVDGINEKIIGAEERDDTK